MAKAPEVKVRVGIDHSDPATNPREWDDKVWEAVIALCSGEGDYATCGDVYVFARELTAFVYGERPADTDK